jgi:hypothetical protein
MLKEKEEEERSRKVEIEEPQLSFREEIALPTIDNNTK